MSFQQQLRDALKEHFADVDLAEKAVQKLQTQLSKEGKYGCETDADAWGLLGSVAPKMIAEMSGLDISTSQWLKERAKQQQQSILSGASPLADAMPTDASDRLRYLLEKEGFKYVKDLGSGGFGRVLLCHNTKLHRDVAIKVLTNVSERTSRQFSSEAKNLASFNNHRNIVQIHNAFERSFPGQSEPYKFIEMEYVKDGNLKQRLDGPKFTHAECMQCFLQLISTVKYLHERRMLHCDIKPENVLLAKDPQDGSVVYKLADFGLSRDESCSVTLSTMTSSIIFGGTRFYMSPERLLPPFTPTMASDVWSLALLFLEVASGRLAPDFFSANGKISAASIEQYCPREFADVLSPCFEDDIKKRCCDLKQLEKAMVSRMFDVFISYRVATETDFALALYNKLVQQKNLRVFLDQSSTGIPLGVEWGPYFLQALSCSTLVVPLVSVPGVLKFWTKDASGQYPVINKADNVLIEHQAALGFYNLHKSGQGSSEMSRVKSVLPLFIGTPDKFDEFDFALCGDIPDAISVGTQKSGKELCRKTGMTFAESFFDKTVKSTWTEFASDVNGKKLSRLNGSNDEEKLVDLCNIIEEQVQKLKPYQPIANSHVLVKLYCRNPEHNRQVVLDICPDHGLLCSDCMYHHSHSACNIRPVKLVDIVGKWDSAHKSLETVQAQFNLIRSNIENEFQQASVARDTFFSELQRRVQFFSDATSTSISKALAEIEDAMKPLHSADPSAEFDGIKRTILALHDRSVPDVFKSQRLNQIIGDLLCLRNEFQRDLDRDKVEWDNLQQSFSTVVGSNPLMSDTNLRIIEYYNVVRMRRIASFDYFLREIDAKLVDLAAALNSTDDPEDLDAILQRGVYKPSLPYARPNVHPASVYDRFGRDFFEQSTHLLPESEMWSWNVCGTHDVDARSLLRQLSGPFPEKLLLSIDKSNVIETEFELDISKLSITAHVPLIAVKLYCFFGNERIFASDSILQRPSPVPFIPGFSESQMRSLGESQILRGDIAAFGDDDVSPLTFKISFKHVASIKNRQLLFVLHRDLGQEPSFSDQGIASVAVRLEDFFGEEAKSFKIPLFNRTVDVDSQGNLLGLRNCCTLWTSDADNPCNLALEISLVCILEFQGSLVPQNLNHQDSFDSPSLSFQSLNRFLTECSVPTCEIDSNESFCVELMSRQVFAGQCDVKFHIVDLSFPSYLPVLYSGDASKICNGLYEISGVANWSVAEHLCIIVEARSTFLPICKLSVSKRTIIKANDCSFICMQHPDPHSTSVLIGSRQKSQIGDDSEKFIPEFVNWRLQFIPLASDLFFEGRRFGFERSEQLGCWVSLQERVNVTNGNVDHGFDASSSCVCTVHKKPCDRVIKYMSSSLVARRIFLCEECVKSRQVQESANTISKVAKDGFELCHNAVCTLLPFCDPSWKLLEQLQNDIDTRDRDVSAEIGALRRGFEICVEKIRGFVLNCASKCIPEPNCLQSFPASDVSLLYQIMDAVCMQGSCNISPAIPCIFTGFSGKLQVGYAHATPPSNLGCMLIPKGHDNLDTLMWQLVNTDNRFVDIPLFLLAFDINFEVCTHGYVNKMARAAAGNVFVKRITQNADDFSVNTLCIGFELNAKHNTLCDVKSQDISIIAWYRQTLIPDVAIVPCLTQRRPNQSNECFDVVDSDINAARAEVVALMSASNLGSIRVMDPQNIHFVAACIFHSFSNDELFCRLRTDVLHVFTHPDVMFTSLQKTKELILSNAPTSKAFFGLSTIHLEAVEKKVLALVSKLIARNHGSPLKIAGLLNDAGFPMTLGSSLTTILKSAAQTDTYYCSRWLGPAAIPGSDGQCGPDNGPQCADCKAAQQLYKELFSSSPVMYLSERSPLFASVGPSTMEKFQFFAGDYIKLQRNADDTKGAICIVRPDKMCADGCVKLSPRACAILRLRLGDNVTAELCDISVGQRAMYRFVGNMPSATCLNHDESCFFHKNGLRVGQEVPVCAGDIFRIRSDDTDFTIQITSTDPEGVCVLTSETEMVCDGCVYAQDESSCIAAPKKNEFPSIGDLVCLQRSDGNTSTLLRKRATSSREASEFVQPHVAIKNADVLTVVREPIENEHEERFVYVRTSSGVQGYVHLKYVVRAPCAESCMDSFAIAPASSVVQSVTNSVSCAQGAPSSSAFGSGHCGEWRAVNERPACRYSSTGERMGDINKYDSHWFEFE